MNDARAFPPALADWVINGPDLPLDGGDLVIFPSLWVSPDLTWDLAAALAAAR